MAIMEYSLATFKMIVKIIE